jgi:DNA-3-methyladenine glycosylase
VTQDAAPEARRPRFGPPLPREFYDRDTAVVARELLGAILECRTPEGLAAGRIVETEAYLGPHDPACHAASGLTARTRHLHGPPGIAYVYFIYGMHWCVNAVTREEGHGSAVLVRAVEPVWGIALMRRRRSSARRDVELGRGPARLCVALGIDGRLDGTPLDRPPLRILAAPSVPGTDVVITPRIGIRRAADWPLRFHVRGSEAVSGPRRKPAEAGHRSVATLGRSPLQG